jgi:acetyl-CoA synthetase
VNIEKKLTDINLNYKRNNIFDLDIDKLYKFNNSEELFDYLAKRLLIWEKEYSSVLDNKNAPFFQWFKHGKICPIKNVLTKHLDTEKRNKAALIWKGSDHLERIFTYQSLYSEVSKMASALTKLGVRHRDKIQIYMPNMPELIITMLACIKIGAVHSVYHYSYSADAFAERIDDCQPVLIVTSNTSVFGYEKNMKSKVDLALEKAKYQPKHCIVVERTPKRVHMKPLRDLWYHDLISDEGYAAASSVEDAVYDANDTLFLLITSTNMNVPKALQFNTAGYLMWALFSYALHFDPGAYDSFWCTADMSWVTGHTYAIYGPLMAGQTTIIFEDSISVNNARRFYDIIEKFRVNKVYTTPSILKNLMNVAQKKKIYRKEESLELIATGGEKMEDDLVEWAFEKLLMSSGPIIDIFTITEAGGAVAGEIPGYSNIKLQSVSKPLPGINLKIFDSKNEEINDLEKTGALMIKGSIPSLCSGICNGDAIYKNTYWKKIGNDYYFNTGDGAEYIENMNLRLTGRIDNVLHIGGKRVSLLEIETALKKHEIIKDAAVVSLHDEKRGDRLVAFCVVNKKIDESYYNNIVDEFNSLILEEIADIKCPDEYRFTKILPKSPDGEILRDMLKEIAKQM